MAVSGTATPSRARIKATIDQRAALVDQDPRKVERSELQLEQPGAAGWSALTVWERETADDSALVARLSRLLHFPAT